jgi:hypothetical protein
MEINAILPVKVVEEYEFIFSSGFLLAISIEPSEGDLIDFGSDRILITKPSKPSLVDPNQSLPAEDVTLFRNHLISIQHRTREVVGRTPDQEVEWQETLKEVGGKIH